MRLLRPWVRGWRRAGTGAAHELGAQSWIGKPLNRGERKCWIVWPTTCGVNSQTCGGFSRRNLFYMRAFAAAWDWPKPGVQSSFAQLPWGPHHRIAQAQGARAAGVVCVAGGVAWLDAPRSGAPGVDAFTQARGGECAQQPRRPFTRRRRRPCRGSSQGPAGPGFSPEAIDTALQRVSCPRSPLYERQPIPHRWILKDKYYQVEAGNRGRRLSVTTPPLYRANSSTAASTRWIRWHRLTPPLEPAPRRIGDLRCLPENTGLGHPANTVRDDLLDLRLVVHRVFLIARAEVEDPALAPRECHTGAEHLSPPGERADKDQVIGFGGCRTVRRTFPAEGSRSGSRYQPQSGARA